MRLSHHSQFLIPALFAVAFINPITAAAALQSSHPHITKDWTFLLFLNGNNNLASFGPTNIKQMENVGSSEKLNAVVEWANLPDTTTKRLYIEKSTDPTNVTSTVVQELPRVDMGDYHSLIDFVQWGVANYPAKHYFIAVWNHGSGWHNLMATSTVKSPIHSLDISFDDNSGHSITTAELGMAMAESAKIIGHKVDIYGSDACLMAMAEVADEMSDSVSYFAGSEETEPGLGWPYEPFFRRWESQQSASPSDVASILTEEYVKAYGGGANGSDQVTFSTFNLRQMANFNRAMSDFAKSVQTLSADDKTKLLAAAGNVQSFAYSDYADLGDFLNLLKQAGLSGIKAEGLQTLRDSMDQLVIANGDTPGYQKANGISFWLPTSADSFNSYKDVYQTLRFQKDTGWGDALNFLLVPHSN